MIEGGNDWRMEEVRWKRDDGELLIVNE